MKVDIQKFLDVFEAEYEFLYDNRDVVAGFDEAVYTFDDFFNRDYRGFKKFVSEFVEYRHDVISSNREAAAFMFTMERMGMFDEGTSD